MASGMSMNDPQTQPPPPLVTLPAPAPASAPAIFQRLDRTARFPYPRSYYLKRAIWVVLYRTLYRWPRAFGLRRAILRALGAKLADTCIIYSSARIYHPWLFELGEHSA